MLYISKKTPPGDMVRKVSEIKSSEKWKRILPGDTKAVRDAFDELPKERIRKSLLEEQRYLCAYCMRPISNDPLRTSTEHLYPLSKDKDLALDYRNMLAVCDGGENCMPRTEGHTRTKILCCDASKGNDAEMTISPLNAAQMSRIAYDTEGFILTEPEDQTLNQDMEKILVLNGIRENGKLKMDTATQLVKGRRDAYLSYKNNLERLKRNGKYTSNSIGKIIQKLEQAAQGQPFAGVLLYFYRKKYQSLLRRENRGY